MPSIEVFGKAGGVEFSQKGPNCANVGRTCGVIMITIVVGSPHCEALFGVKVYVLGPVTVVVMTAGLQVPVIPSIEVFGKAGGVEFSQKGPNCANVGRTCGCTVTDKLTTESQPLELVSVSVNM